MKTKLTFFILLIFSIVGYSQKEFHVTIDGNASGDGSLEKPWDLQTALIQPPTVIKSGNIIWLHKGVYKGRFISRLRGEDGQNKIIVSSYPLEWAILDGNVNEKVSPVLTVTGKNVIYKNFQVSPIDLTTRTKTDSNFVEFTGIYHTNGKNCEFLNLVIYGNNGLGFGSWNKTGGSIIKNCLIYDNGYLNEKGKGIGEGIYVQNDSDDEVRVIADNIIFNNYYKGIEVWSANINANREYVKNISILNNVIFNSGLVANRTVDNIIVATDDRNGINIAKNILIKNNILFHKIDFLNNEVNGDAPSLTIGFKDNSPVDNVQVLNNIIVGKNNPVRILHAKKFLFEGNTVYGGYVHISNDNFKSGFVKNWTFDNNTFFTKNSTPLYLIKEKKYSLKDWKHNFGLDNWSTSGHSNNFNLPEIVDITRNATNPNLFRVVLFDKNHQDSTEIDFKEYSLKDNSKYIIRDVENYDNILAESKLKNSKLSMPMASKDKAFGVYLIEFKE